MNNATLVYRVKYNNEYKDLVLEHNSLFSIDNKTSSFKNEKDFIENYCNKDKIFNFIKKNNNIKGKIIIDYRRSLNKKEILEPIFDNKDEIIFNEDYLNNKVTEIEKARKLLFNSKNQLFTKILLNSHLLDSELNRVFCLEDEEVKFAKNNGVNIKLYNNNYYVTFKELLVYRINSNKLGLFRNIYQDMLDILKEKLSKKDVNSFYFYNREIRLLIEKYNKYASSIFIKNINIKNIDYKEKYKVMFY